MKKFKLIISLFIILLTMSKVYSQNKKEREIEEKLKQVLGGQIESGESMNFSLAYHLIEFLKKEHGKNLELIVKDEYHCLLKYFNFCNKIENGEIVDEHKVVKNHIELYERYKDLFISNNDSCDEIYQQFLKYTGKYSFNKKTGEKIKLDKVKHIENIIRWYKKEGNNQSIYTWQKQFHTQFINAMLSNKKLTVMQRAQIATLVKDHRIWRKPEAYLRKWWINNSPDKIKEKDFLKIWRLDALEWGINNMDNKDPILCFAALENIYELLEPGKRDKLDKQIADGVKIGILEVIKKEQENLKKIKLDLLKKKHGIAPTLLTLK